MKLSEFVQHCESGVYKNINVKAEQLNAMAEQLGIYDKKRFVQLDTNTVVCQLREDVSKRRNS